MAGPLLKLIRFILRISGSVRRARSTFLLVVLFGLISGLANTGLIVLITRGVTDRALLVGGLGWAFAGLCLGLPACRFLSQVMLVRIIQRTLYQLRLTWCRQILSMPLRQLEEIGPSRLVASLTTDLAATTDAFGLLPLVFMNLVVILTCLMYLGYLSATLLAGLLGFMVFGILTYQLPVLRALVHERRARETWDDLFGYIRAATAGAKELKMHRPRRHALMTEKIEPAADAMRRHVNAEITVFAAAASWGHVLFFITIGLLLFVAPEIRVMTQEVVVGYSVTLVYMMTPLEMVLNAMPQMTRASVASDKLGQLGFSLEQASAEPETALREMGGPAWRRLELVGIEHTYFSRSEGESFSLGPLDLAFEPGELVFITGGNGSGKTTLAKLLLGLYPPDGGAVHFDGEPVTDENRDQYRQNFAVVFSDFFLFDTLLGLDEPGLDVAARKYLSELKLENKVRIENGELSTTELSQGQQRRLALLTAYLEDRPLYLFDEWAADQDPLFKEIFYRQLLPDLKARGKTVLVISHDDHYYGVADRIVKLDSGRLDYDRRLHRPSGGSRKPGPV